MLKEKTEEAETLLNFLTPMQFACLVEGRLYFATVLNREIWKCMLLPGLPSSLWMSSAQMKIQILLLVPEALQESQIFASTIPSRSKIHCISPSSSRVGYSINFRDKCPSRLKIKANEPGISIRLTSWSFKRFWGSMTSTQNPEFMPLITMPSYHTWNYPPLLHINLSQNINSLPRDHFLLCSVLRYVQISPAASIP